MLLYACMWGSIFKEWRKVGKIEQGKNSIDQLLIKEALRDLHQAQQSEKDKKEYAKLAGNQLSRFIEKIRKITKSHKLIIILESKERIETETSRLQKGNVDFHRNLQVIIPGEKGIRFVRISEIKDIELIGKE